VLSPDIGSFEAMYIITKPVKTAAGTEKEKIKKNLTLVKCDAN
jgi:hypothetical protein